MQFLYPGFLYALLALAIPVIIHLFYFRRFKKVYFTNVRFLKEVKEETSVRRKIRNLLVLIMRMLALAFLVFAFAQPFIPQSEAVQKGRKAVSIFIDNSFSMQALSEDVSLLDKAKMRAGEIIKAYRVDDEFQVLTNDFEGRHQRMLGREDALSLIDEISVSPAVRNISTVANRQMQALTNSGIDNQQAYQISDFQKNITDLNALQDSMLKLDLIPLQAVQERNVSIDSAWFEAPVQMLNQTNTLLVKIRNLSNEPLENIRLSLKHEGQTKPVGTLTVPPQTTITDTVPITILRTGWHEGLLSITDYPIQFDDDYFFSFYVAENIDVLLINEAAPNEFLSAAFRGIPYFNAVNQPSHAIKYSQFPNYHLIVLNDLRDVSSGLASELKQYVENGGNLLVFPNAEADVSSYAAFLKAFPANEFTRFESGDKSVGRINTDEFIFKDVFENKSAHLKLPATQGNFKLTNLASRGEERLMTYRDGTSYLSKFQIGQGKLYLCTAPLDINYNSLVRNSEIFIPMLYKMAISSARVQRIAYTIGKDEVIETDLQMQGSKETIFKMRGANNEFIPDQRVVASRVFLTTGHQVEEAGIYTLYADEASMLAKFAFNYDRKESQLAYYTPDELKALAENALARVSVITSNADTNFTELIGVRSQGISLWRWCLILTLLFLAMEGLFLRLWKP